MPYEYTSIYIYGMTADEFTSALSELGSYGWVYKARFMTYDKVGDYALMQRYYEHSDDDDDE